MVTLAWVLAHPAVAFAKARWKAVQGTMTGVIATLLDRGVGAVRT